MQTLLKVNDWVRRAVGAALVEAFEFAADLRVGRWLPRDPLVKWAALVALQGIVPGLAMDPPMIRPRFPSWAQFWAAQGEDAVAQLTAHP